MSHNDLSKPFLHSVASKNSSNSLLRFLRKTKHKSEIWQKLAQDKSISNIYSLNDSSLDRSNNFKMMESNNSLLKELKRYQSVDSISDSKMKMRFQDIRQKLSSQKNLRNRSLFRDSSFNSEQTFCEKVYE